MVERVGQGVRCDFWDGELQCLFSLREKLVKTLVELLTNQVGEKMVVVLALRLLYLLMTKHEWRPLFAREGGIYAVLVCMQEYKTSVLVQQAGLAVSGLGLVGESDGQEGQAGGPLILRRYCGDLDQGGDIRMERCRWVEGSSGTAFAIECVSEERENVFKNDSQV